MSQRAVEGTQSPQPMLPASVWTPLRPSPQPGGIRRAHADWAPPWRGHGSPLQYSCLGNPMDRGAWYKSINSLVLSFLYGPTLTSIHDHWRNHRGEKAGRRWVPSAERPLGTRAVLGAGPQWGEWTGRPRPVGPQPSRAAPGKSGLHARGEGERV